MPCSLLLSNCTHTGRTDPGACCGQHRFDARHPDPVPEAFDEVLAHGRPAPVDGRAGWYDCNLTVQPHIQFEGMDVTLRVDARLS